MNTIFKWALELGRTELHMPADAQILTAQMQNGKPHLWALIDDDMPLVWRAFEIYGTGQGIPFDHGRYVATFQANNGTFVGHVFESAPTL